MSETKARKWRDAEGSVYGVERTVRNGRCVVIRTNAGGHRKAVKQFSEGGRAAGVQHLLDAHAIKNGWQEL